MSKKHHRIAADVKADILRRVKEEGVSVAQAAKDHGISEGTLYGWMVNSCRLYANNKCRSPERS
jgi:transposase-like protein